jgi:hypothetical protein
MKLIPLKLIGRVARDGLLGASLFFPLAVITANAQEITGTPGSPEATMAGAQG